ncbi:RNA polymerase sigma factor [Streptomyces kronopolitis]|uniref:RNA polymerase sigma factor n=1 Tax=Streptomyces kronopolitis TaxID=1612435 RepID=UPI0020BF240C|nr:RNA polymerase sigma factor [Streptomyces kronopolitis]MCL6299481.1 RNA polymerase sigma factor [Streptomyces kronopolitis]
MSTVNSPSALTITALLPRAQAGDGGAMNELLRHIAPFVERLCRAVTRQHSCDAAQEALLAIYRGIGGLREATAFYGWARAVTVREAVRTSKRLSRETAGELPEIAQDSNPLTLVHISGVLDKLSDQHRQILVLRAVYGLNENETAIALSVPVGTVRSRLHRARGTFSAAWHEMPA